MTEHNQLPAARPYVKDQNQIDYRYAVIPLNQITIDKRYQRPLNEARLQRMVNNFQRNLLGVLVLSLRHDGRYYALDGQHRFRLLNKVGWTTAPSIVYENLAEAQEAMLFEQMNTQRATPDALTLFRAKVMGGDVNAIKVLDILTGQGWEVPERPGFKTHKPGTMSAIRSCELAYERYGPEVFEITVNVLRNAWPHSSVAGSSKLVLGLSKMIMLFYDILKVKRLFAKLQVTTPGAILTRGSQLKDAIPGLNKAEDSVGMALWGQYTSNMRNKLPSWETRKLRKSQKTGKYVVQRLTIEQEFPDEPDEETAETAETAE
jgi:hypothetical protein